MLRWIWKSQQLTEPTSYVLTVATCCLFDEEVESNILIWKNGQGRSLCDMGLKMWRAGEAKLGPALT
jgi:hypothetical protein